MFLTFLAIPLHSQTFGGRQRVFTGPNPYGIKAVDVNKDGNQDIIWFSSDHNVEIRLGLGDGRFVSSGPIYNTMLTHASEFEVAAMNRDGHLDIVVAGNHSIAVLRGNGDGTFQAPVLFGISNTAEHDDPSDSIDSLALGDFNKDGKVDALVSIGSSIQIAFGKGDGTFQSPAKVFPNGLQGFHYQFEGQLSNNAESGDFDGDGNLDVAFYTCCDPAVSSGDLLFGGTLWAWYGDGRGNFPVKKAIQTDVALVRIKVFDINQDGKKDILYSWKRCHDSCADGVTTLLYAGSRTFTSQNSALSSGADYSIETGVAFGDFDLDGVLDLVTGANTQLPGGFFLFRRHANGTMDSPQF
ncbi:MAG TPA: VCBS repeat-containing protein, partial [Terriglobales bacterium]|nr:VCBS repeat-containing protein [Terriglobales bacterium]